MSVRLTTALATDPRHEDLGARGRVSFFHGRSAPTCDYLAQIETIARRSTTVLIDGETGVGKEVAARQIHARSSRASKLFVPVDCTAFSSQLIESQLFGHVKGAFTDAIGVALGFVRCADGGTLFLDEIGELPLAAQAKLLRCIQERVVVPVGGVDPIPVNLRIIAATHRDLARMVREGSFRQDLYYRLNVVRLHVSPLRDRRDDIVPLARHFLHEIALTYEEPTKALATVVDDLLFHFDWPGNVRELRNAMERAFLFCNDRTIEVEHLPSEIREFHSDASAACSLEHAAKGPNSIPHLADAERLLIVRVLQVTGGNQSDAARLLDVERHRLRRIIARHGLGHLTKTRSR